MTLDQQFADDMIRLSDTAAKRGYHPRYFLQMIETRGAVAAARILLKGESVQSGLFRLAELGLLQHSMENIMLNPKYVELFTTTEKRVAGARLEALGFTPGLWE
ncbi:MAG: hypothetical protein P4L46_12895 [Fimbriimonas sp.]|nr:hypothetical protein [Fimbriimonas sp.]